METRRLTRSMTKKLQMDQEFEDQVLTIMSTLDPSTHGAQLACNLLWIRCAAKLGFAECNRYIGKREVEGKTYDALTFRLEKTR